jgi:hypothetical protein
MQEGPVDLDALVAKNRPPSASEMVVAPKLDQPRVPPLTPQVVVVADHGRLAKPSQRVTVLNTSRQTNHIVIDRFMHGHELRPGEHKEIEMLTDEIESFRLLGRENRGVYTSGHLVGLPLPSHPLQFIDLPRPESARQDDGGGGDGHPVAEPLKPGEKPFKATQRGG